MFVKFSSKTYQVNETSFVTVIPVYRHGNLSAPTAVICTTSPDTADDKDYFNTQRILTFQINETMKGQSLSHPLSLSLFCSEILSS